MPIDQPIHKCTPGACPFYYSIPQLPMNYKSYKSIIIKSIFTCFASCFTCIAFAQQRPNIIFIFIDDMGYSDLSCFGNKEIETPNIDRLAKEGMRFTNFYDNSPICSPSRVAAITGSYPSRYRIYSYLDSREKNRQRGMADFLDSSAPTIARNLKKRAMQRLILVNGI